MTYYQMKEWIVVSVLFIVGFSSIHERGNQIYVPYSQKQISRVNARQKEPYIHEENIEQSQHTRIQPNDQKQNKEEQSTSKDFYTFNVTFLYSLIAANIFLVFMLIQFCRGRAERRRHRNRMITQNQLYSRPLNATIQSPIQWAPYPLQQRPPYPPQQWAPRPLSQPISQPMFQPTPYIQETQNYVLEDKIAFHESELQRLREQKHQMDKRKKREFQIPKHLENNSYRNLQDVPTGKPIRAQNAPLGRQVGDNYSSFASDYPVI